jgi:Flp pilus assembly protein TadD
LIPEGAFSTNYLMPLSASGWSFKTCEKAFEYGKPLTPEGILFELWCELIGSRTGLEGAGKMVVKRWATVGLVSTILSWGPAHAGDLKITVPKRSHLTPVQRLNREGVEDLRKHHYEKGEALFYKAYLLDPDDPFTLNNLGYVAELQGQVERAQSFYALAAKQSSDAVIDIASGEMPGAEGKSSDRKQSRLKGHSMNDVLSLSDVSLRINHDNVEALRLLSEKRALEADRLIKETLKRDPNNVFALNNMGVAKEMEGESEEALKYYDEAAAVHSNTPAVVTLNRSWRGKPVSEMAAQNARNLRKRLATESLDAKLAELNFRGVAAVNSNDLAAADRDFRSAYELNPNNAFALNNVGYLYELQGDRETAQFYYDKAQTAAGANGAVGLASRRSAEGQKLFQVASDSDSRVEAKVDQERELRRAQHEPIVLRRRDNSMVDESGAAPSSPQPPSSQPSRDVLPPQSSTAPPSSQQ